MEPRRAFCFGVVCWQGRLRHDWREKARQAEQLGYATFLVPDHLQDQLAPVPALLAAADATATLRIGGHVFANDFRHPVMLAREAATLWMGSVGSDREVGLPPACADLPDLRPLLGLPAAWKPRRTRPFRLGWLWALVCQITARPIPLPWRLVPEPWPDSPICVGLLPGPSQAEEHVYG